MTIPITLGLPQIILFALFVLGLGLLISAGMGGRRGRLHSYIDEDGEPRYYRRRRGFHWGRSLGGILLIALALSVLWLTALVQTYLGLTSDVLAARVQATSFSNVKHLMNVQVTLYDSHGHPTSTNMYAVNGDEWMLQADVIEFQPWVNILGVHSGYKLTRLEGRYDDLDLERHAEHTVVPLNGGDDNFFKTVQDQAWSSPFIKGAYGSGTFLRPDGRAYNVFMSQDGLKAEPAK